MEERRELQSLTYPAACGMRMRWENAEIKTAGHLNTDGFLEKPVAVNFLTNRVDGKISSLAVWAMMNMSPFAIDKGEILHQRIFWRGTARDERFAVLVFDRLNLLLSGFFV